MALSYAARWIPVKLVVPAVYWAMLRRALQTVSFQLAT